MSGMFSKPKTPDIPRQEQVENVSTIEDDASAEQQRAKRRIYQEKGRGSTLTSGIAMALKRRLGE